jgi:hypothetical protein
VIFAVFSGEEYACGNNFGLLCLGILIALIPILGAVLRYLIKWHRDLVTQQTESKNWHEAIDEKLKAQEMKQHWLEILVITIMELMISGDNSKDHAVMLLEDFKNRYPNPRTHNISVCKCYTYTLLRTKRGAKLRWQPEK